MALQEELASKTSIEVWLKEDFSQLKAEIQGAKIRVGVTAQEAFEASQRSMVLDRA